MKRLLIVVWCLFGLLNTVGCKATPDTSRADQARAAAIITALDAYQEKYGQFPGRLEILKADYLREIPKTVANQEFIYVPDALAGYYLCFDPPNGAKCCYMHRLEIWDCTRAVPE